MHDRHHPSIPRTFLLLAVIGMSWMPCGHRSARGDVFRPMGFLSGSNTSRAESVTPDGKIVVGVSGIDSGTINRAFRWSSASGFTSLEPLDAQLTTSVSGVSADGSVIVGQVQTANGIEAYRWTEATGKVGLGNLSPGTLHSFALAVSDDGQTVIGSGSIESEGIRTSMAYRWTERTGMVALGFLPGRVAQSVAYDTTPDGSKIVGFGTMSEEGQFENEAFYWTQATGMVGLGDLPGGRFNSIAHGISDDGNVIVGRGWSVIGTEPFIWSVLEGMQSLGSISNADPSGIAYAVSADGSAVVGTSGGEAFYWNEKNGIRSISRWLTILGADMTGWELLSARGISADGNTVVGYGRNPQGQIEAFIALVPEPSALALCIPLLALATLRRR